jgi:hypothetical protein
MAPAEGSQADPGGGPPGNIKSFAQAVREGTSTSFPAATFTESTLVNALTFDFRAHKGSLPDLIKQVGAYYTGQIASLVKHSTLKCVQVGFKREIDITQIVHDGFAIDNQVVPKYRCFRNVANIMRLRASRLPGQDDEQERAEIAKALSPYGRVLDIFYFKEPVLGVNTSHGIIQIDRTPVDGKEYEELPRKVLVDGSDILLSWPQAPQFCVYCRSQGHTKGNCERKKRSDARRNQYQPKRVAGSKRRRTVKNLEGKPAASENVSNQPAPADQPDNVGTAKDNEISLPHGKR